MTSLTKHSESVNAKGTSVPTSMENKYDGPYKGQGSGDDSEEEPSFPFEYRGKQVGQVAGLTSDQSKTKTVRPPDKVNSKEEERDELDERAAAEAIAKKKKGKKN